MLTRLAVLALLLLTTVAAAQPPDAPTEPRTLLAERALVLTADTREWVWLQPAVCQDEAAAINTANRLLDLEHRQQRTALAVALAFWAGIAAGIAAARLASR